MNSIQQFIPTKSLISFSICASAATEMAYRAATKQQSLDNFSKDLAGSLFYGLCAANVVPGSAHMGSLIFSGYSLSTHHTKDAYQTAKILGNTLETVVDKIIEPVTKKLYTDVIEPTAIKISKVCAAIVSKINLPMNPAWYGVATLLIASAVHRSLPKP